MNFIRTTRKLVAAVAHDPEDGQPKEWERTTRRAKLKRAVVKYPYLAIAAGFFAVALLLFFYPVLPSAHRSGWTLAVGLFAVSVAVAYWQGRVKAYETLKQYHLNILFTGRSIVPRLGKETGDIDDRLTGFKILRKFGSGGITTAYEQFRDRYSRTEIASHKEKYHRADSDGSGDVVHGILKNTTFDAETMDYGIDLFDGISVTHAGAEEERLDSKKMETATSLPPVLDTRTSAQVESAFRAEARGRKHADQELSLLHDHVDRLEEHVDPAGQPLFERTRQLLDEMNEQKQRQRQSNRRQTNDNNTQNQ